MVKAIDAEMDVRLADITARTADSWEAFAARCRGYLIMMTELQAQRILLRDSPSVLGADYLQASKLACIVWMTGAFAGTHLLRRAGIIGAFDQWRPGGCRAVGRPSPEKRRGAGAGLGQFEPVVGRAAFHPRVCFADGRRAVSAAA